MCYEGLTAYDYDAWIPFYSLDFVDSLASLYNPNCRHGPRHAAAEASNQQVHFSSQMADECQKQVFQNIGIRIAQIAHSRSC